MGLGQDNMHRQPACTEPTPYEGKAARPIGRSNWHPRGGNKEKVNAASKNEEKAATNIAKLKPHPKAVGNKAKAANNTWKLKPLPHAEDSRGNKGE